MLGARGAGSGLGKGEMSYLPRGSAKLIRARGGLITDQKNQSMVAFIARQAKPSYEMEIHKQLSKPAGDFADESGIDEDEEIIQNCIEVIRSEQKPACRLCHRDFRPAKAAAAAFLPEWQTPAPSAPSKGP